MVIFFSIQSISYPTKISCQCSKLLQTHHLEKFDHCLFPLKWKIHVTSISHAHLQTLTKTLAKLQKDPAKIVGGVEISRYYVSICFGRSQAKNDKDQTAIKNEKK